MSKVQVKPLDIERWHGKKGEESFTRSRVIHALVDATTMRYKTGLTPEEEEKYGKLTGSNLTDRFNPDEAHPFWDSRSGEVRLENATKIYDLEDPNQFVKVAIMKGSKFVANSIKEWEDGLWPFATHVLIDDDEDVEIQASKIEAIDQAIIEASKLSKDRKIELVLILGGKLLKGKSDNFVKVELSNLINKSPVEVLRYIKMDKKEVATHALVLEALQKYVFTKSGHKILYHENVLGEDLFDVIKYLNKPENQEFRLKIVELVNN